MEAIELNGRRWPVTRPDRATIEELMQQLFSLQRAWEAASDEDRTVLAARVHRLNAAFIGLCTQLGEQAKASWTKAGCDAMLYGGKVLSHLLEVGVRRDELGHTSKGLAEWLAQHLFPRAKEVEDRASFS